MDFSGFLTRLNEGLVRDFLSIYGTPLMKNKMLISLRLLLLYRFGMSCCMYFFSYYTYFWLFLFFSMTLSELGDNYESFWHCSNDHRTVRFVNRSSEWLELKGTLQIGTNRTMSSISKIPPRSVYTHRFVGKHIKNKIEH